MHQNIRRGCKYIIKNFAILRIIRKYIVLGHEGNKKLWNSGSCGQAKRPIYDFNTSSKIGVVSEVIRINK